MPELNIPERLEEKSKRDEQKFYRAQTKLRKYGLRNIELISFLGVPLWKFSKEEIYNIGLRAVHLDKRIGELTPKDMG